MHFRGSGCQCKQTCNCLKGLHMREVYTNITIVVQKIIFVIIYNFLFQFLYHYFYLYSFKFLQFCQWNRWNQDSDVFIRYPKLTSGSYPYIRSVGYTQSQMHYLSKFDIDCLMVNQESSSVLLIVPSMLRHCPVICPINLLSSHLLVRSTMTMPVVLYLLGYVATYSLRIWDADKICLWGWVKCT